MKKINLRLLINLWAVFCLCLFVSCHNEEGTSQEGLPGYWYGTYDNQVYSLLFSKDGTGQITCHTYSNGQWDREGSFLQYTLSGNLLTVKSTESEIWTFIIGISGNSMSLTDGDFIAMLTRYNGSEKKINDLKQEYEDNLEDSLPNDNEVEDSWGSESDIENAIRSIYNRLCDYEYKQMLLEKIRITHKDFYDNPMPRISPSDIHVADAWDAAYQTIYMTNALISVLESPHVSVDENRRIAYTNEATALRCMIYYNLSQLWGNIPYATQYNKNNFNEIILSSPILSPEDLCPMLDGILQGISILPEDGQRITMETVKAIRAEIALSLGNKDEARYLLQDCQANFYLFVDESSHPEMYRIFGGQLPNYSPEKTALLLQEACMASPEDASAVLTGWKAHELWWGYWTMLKRTGHAKATAGCEDYELLMPIPQKEVELMPSLPQNPGY